MGARQTFLDRERCGGPCDSTARGAADRQCRGGGDGLGRGQPANQVINDGHVSWSWAYLAFGFTVLVTLLSAYTDRSSQQLGRRVPRVTRAVYLRQLRASVRDMETVGILTQSEFRPQMRQVYVDVSLAPKPPHSTLREPYLGAVTRPLSGDHDDRRTLESFLERGDLPRRLAVIGGPGSGKTTLARHTALSLCGRDWRVWRRRPLPVLLYLRDHATAVLKDEDPPGLAAVATSAGWLAGKVPASWLERRLDRGGCVVLLDGLDEVPDERDRDQVVGWVQRQIERYPGNHYVLTSRPHGYRSSPLTTAEVLQVRRFTGEQIAQFLSGWYYAIECRATGVAGSRVRAEAEGKARDLIGRLRAEPALYDLAANPLLLTMIANVHRYRGQLPGTRARLYAETCDALLHRRQEDRNLTDATGLRGEQKERVARELALAMMRDRIRDLPRAGAEKAIEEALRRVPGYVAPHTFLEEAHKSGLLVEREQGVYAFAHLTLQEYLAAAHIRESPDRLPLLTDAVDDPWWRETILLWSADANATPIIAACLASGTVGALALAFDCVEQAAEVEPEKRQELDDLLSSPETDGEGNEARRRLIAGVKATRSLREVISLSESTTICARPVTRDLYTLFVRDEQREGRYPPEPERFGQNQPGDAPATGIWAGDAERFVNWLNALLDEDVAYRLPTPHELADPAVNLVADLTDRTIWAQSDTGPCLHQPHGVRNPYTPDPDRLKRYPAADMRRNGFYLLFALIPHDLTRALAYGRVLALGRARAHEFSTNPDLGILELILTLATARDLDHAHRTGSVLDRAFALHRARDLKLDLELTRDLDLARDRVLYRARLLAIDLGLDLDLAFGLDRALDRVFDIARGRARDLGLDLDLALGLAPDLDRDRARDLARNISDMFARTLDRVVDVALALDQPPAPDPDPDGVLVRVVDLTVALALIRDPDGALAHDLDGVTPQGHLPHRDLARALARDLAHAFASTLDRALDRPLDRPLVLDLAVALAIVPDGKRLQRVVTAFRDLLGLWAPAETSELLTDFDAFLTGVLPQTSQPGTSSWNGPAALVQQACDLLGGPPGHPDGGPQAQARLRAAHAHAVITPILDRTASYDSRALSCARIELLAAIALLQQRQGDDGMAVTLLVQALHSLVALQERAEGHLAPNEALLLVRT